MEKITDVLLRKGVDPNDITFCDDEGNFGISEHVFEYIFNHSDTELDRNSPLDRLVAYNLTMIKVYELVYEPETSYSKINIPISLSMALEAARLPERITNPSKLWNYYREWLKQYDDFIDRKKSCYNLAMGQMFAKHLKEIFSNDESNCE